MAERLISFGILAFYLSLMLLAAYAGTALPQDVLSVGVEMTIFVLALLVEGFVVVWKTRSNQLAESILFAFKARHEYWVEGCLFRNKKIWRDNKGVAPGAWPSMSDNMSSFGMFVMGPRVTLILVVMLPSVMLLSMAQYGQVWFSHLQNSLNISMIAPDTVHTHVNLGDVVFHPWASCEYFQFVPLPYSYCIGKVVFVSFVQDVAFGVKNLHETKDRNLGPIPWLFSSLTVAMVIHSWVGGLTRVADNVFGTNPWNIYEGLLYYVNMQPSIGSLLLLTVKLFCETNVTAQGGPPGLGRLLGDHGDKSWRIPSYSTHRSIIFWIGVFVLSVGFLPLGLTHIIPMSMAFAAGLLFPFWAPIFCFFEVLTRGIHPFFDQSTNQRPRLWLDALQKGAGMHCRAWESVSSICFMTLAGVLLRKWLWEFHAFLRKIWKRCRDRGEDDSDIETSTEEEEASRSLMGNTPNPSRAMSGTQDTSEPHGPYGFNLACYQVFFSMPILAYSNSMVSAGVAVYSGAWSLEEVWMADFTSREVLPYNQCVLSGVVPLGARLDALLSLL
mmetsp:Transcript_93533/g.195001  ORF Transcript_93533/g.195001 Transcript_93533/m.195001 type:complete len:555 (-) Transcript_93533:30-1694(-)